MSDPHPDTPTEQELLQEALANAISTGDAEVAIAGINSALAKGATLRDPFVGPLWLAATANNVAVLRHLLSLGHTLTVEMETTGPEGICGLLGNSPLHAAAFGGFAECLRLLVAQPDAHKFLNSFEPIPVSNTPLAKAVEADSVECVRILLQAGADPNVFSEQRINYTPLDIAVMGFKVEMVRILLDAGADPDLPTWMQVTPRQHAKDACPCVIREMIAAVPYESRRPKRK